VCWELVLYGCIPYVVWELNVDAWTDTPYRAPDAARGRRRRAAEMAWACVSMGVCVRGRFFCLFVEVRLRAPRTAPAAARRDTKARGKPTSSIFFILI
jgi:hypothetical protein